MCDEKMKWKTKTVWNIHKQHRIFKWKKLWWDITFPYFFQWNWDPSRPFAHPQQKPSHLSTTEEKDEQRIHILYK